jgi:hypothetical protein
MRRTVTSVLVAASLFTAGLLAGGALRASADQPHMEAALASLRSALDQLKEASHDKGGHRVRAMDLVKQAIDEVESGIAVGRGE